MSCDDSSMFAKRPCKCVLQALHMPQATGRATVIHADFEAVLHQCFSNATDAILVVVVMTFVVIAELPMLLLLSVLCIKQTCTQFCPFIAPAASSMKHIVIVVFP